MGKLDIHEISIKLKLVVNKVTRKCLESSPFTVAFVEILVLNNGVIKLTSST